LFTKTTIYIFFEFVKQIIGVCMGLEFDAFEIYESILKNKKKSGAVLFGLIVLLSLIAGVMGQLIVVLLMVAAIAVAIIVGKFDMNKIGIELVTFTTVISGFLFGPFVGAAVGAVLMTLHFFISGSLGIYIVYAVPTMAIIGLISGYPAMATAFGGSIVRIGIVLSFVYNLITASLGTFFLNDPIEEMVWSGSNFIFNVLVFLKFAPIILSIV